VPYARAVFRGEPQKSSPQMRCHVKSSSVALAGTFVATLRDYDDEFAVTGIQRGVGGRGQRISCACTTGEYGRI